MERVIRKFAIGRNDGMFSDTVAGAESSALLYSLVITAKLNEKDPFEVLAEILRLLPSADTIEDYERLASLLVKKTVV
ncbi:MAG: transposase domain-containing protein [Bdellovibrionales bacterium]|nr:transposase domain-containing protein [Bdellovibrionales bacterium]